MQNLYFKGLEKALDDGCYIRVFSCAMRNPVVRVEKRNKQTEEEELISYAEGGNILSALQSASNKIIDEISETSGNIWCENTLIDRVVEYGYTLQFFKLINGQILSIISTNLNGEDIPIKSILSDSIAKCIELLNATLSPFNRTEDFYNYVQIQIKPIQDYQKKLAKKNN